MLPGPIFRREVKAAAVGRKLLAGRIVLILTIAVFVLAPAAMLLDPTFYLPWRDVSRATAAWVASAYVVGATFLVEVVIVALLAAGTVAAGIAEEREKDTLPLLLLTRLTRLELVATKLAGRLMPSLLTMLTGLPLILFGAWITDLPALAVVEALAVIASTAAAAGGLGILASSRRDRSGQAVAEASGWTLIWLLGLPIAALTPARSGTLWGDLLVELRRVAGWLAPSSPLSLLTEPSWWLGSRDVVGALSDRVSLMLAMQAGLFVAALAGAVAGLRRREPHPTSSDPRRVARPPVGDDPILWREYELPFRSVRGSIGLALARRLLIVLRTLLLLAIEAVVLAAMGAILIGLVVAAGWFGYFAFREAWGLDSRRVRPFEARIQLDVFLAFVTYLLGVMPMAGAASVAAQITIERDKKTWESLLMTRLTGAEILSSKRRVLEKTLWAVQRWLIPLWLLGIVCGALHPLGVVLAAVGLTTGIRLGLALGIRGAIRPGATTRSANVTSNAWYLAMTFAGPLLVVLPLIPVHAFEGPPWVPWLGAAVLAAAAIAMTAWERSVTRRCFERFDEWVGRPHRAAWTDPGGSGPPWQVPGPAAPVRDESRTPSAAGVK